MPSAMTVFGALNLNARNFEVELRRAVEKLENGMSGFLTQPVLSAQAVENLRKARQTLGERAKILAGIMPVVSQRNAIFMENEINGIHVEEDIIQRLRGPRPGSRARRWALRYRCRWPGRLCPTPTASIS